MFIGVGNRYHFPRIITGILVGMNLAVAGVLLQGVLRNPMASPNIIGVNAGAGLMAVMLMTILPSYLLLLAGVAISAFLTSITSGMMMFNSDVLDVTYSWMLGSLSGRSWSAVKSILSYSIVGILAAILLAPKVNLFSLGDELATSIGLKTGVYRIIIIIVSSILAGSAVSAAGAIGFVGLVAPHTARIIIGNDHRYLIPLSAIFGSILLVVSDTLARTVFQPVELSVGIVTGVIGAPFFLYLLRRNKDEL